MNSSDFEIKSKIISFLRENPAGASASEIANRINHNRITIGKYLQILKAEKLVTSTKIASAMYWKLAEFSKKFRVLVADDEKNIVDLIRLSLSEGRYDIYEAYDGEKASEMINKIIPDIIVLDLMMPKKSGEDLCKEVKRNVLTKNIPVIILSAKGEIKDKVNLMDMGADDYITKPFDPLELEARIQSRLKVKEGLYSVNPITGIPSKIIAEENKNIWDKKNSWYEIKVKVNHFDDYVKFFGHKKSYETIQLIGKMIMDCIKDENNFIGHIEDNIFTIFSSKDISKSIDEMKKRFTETLPYLYTGNDNKGDFKKMSLVIDTIKH
ncbi:MAG: response regulator [Nanobdellota archaeon]